MEKNICSVKNGMVLDRSVKMKMEQCADFIARMIEKYGREVLEEIEAEEKQKVNNG